MGSNVQGEHTLRGFLVHDDRIKESNLRVSDAATGNSDYSQAGSRPGSTTPPNSDARLTPRITGEMGATPVLVKGTKAGSPGRTEDAFSAMYRLNDGTETDTAYRSWNPPNLITEYPGSITFEIGVTQFFGCTTIPSTQQPVVVYTDKGTNTSDIEARVWSWTTKAWGAAVDISGDLGTATSATNDGALDVICLPETERLLLIYEFGTSSVGIDVAFSDDSGATWSAYAREAVAGSGTSDRLRAAVTPLGDIIVITSDGSNKITQYASNDLGATFTQVEARTSTANDASVHALPGSEQLIVTYRDNTNNYARCARITSAFQPTSEATVVQVDGTDNIALEGITSYVDADGTIYIYGRESTVGSKDLVHCWFSTDQGDTFTEFTTAGGAAASNLLYQGGGGDNTRFHPQACTPANGWGFIFGDGFSVHDPDDIHCIAAGGWSSLVADHGKYGSTLAASGDIDGIHSRAFQMGWGFDTSNQGLTWFPNVLPDDNGLWVDTAGTDDAVTADGLVITSSASNTYYDLDPAWTTAGEGVSFLYELSVDSGGATTINGDCATNIRIADGTDDVQILIAHDTTDVRVWDINAGTALTSATTVTTAGERIQIAGYFTVNGSGSAGYAEIWYKTPFATTWTELYAGTVQNDGAGPANNLIQWGHIVSTTTTSSWYQFHFRAANSGTTNCRWRHDRTHGRPLGTLPYPIPEAGSTSGEAFLRAEAGPGLRDEVYTISPAFDYPIGALFTPDPGQTWRSTDNSAQTFAFDLTDDSALGESYCIGFYLERCNFQQANLVGWNGSSWTVLVALDLDILDGTSGTDVPCTVSGNIVNPGTVTDEPDRFVQAGELRDGLIIFDHGGTEKGRRIVSNTGGLLTDIATDTVHPVIRYAGYDGTETNSDCWIGRHSGVAYVYLLSRPEYDRFAIQIPSGQTSPDAESYWEIGRLIMGGIVGVGRQWSRGFNQRFVRQVEETQTNGVTRTRELAEPVEEWTLSWVDGVDLRDLRRDEAADIDYLGSTAANAAPLVADKDAPWQMIDMLKRAKSGELPVVALTDISSSSSIGHHVDPTMFLAGTLVSSVQLTHVVGDEGTGKGEVYRIEPITIRGDSK